jgi:molybdopterin/thiamine biosynthesis adenylyltransferase
MESDLEADQLDRYSRHALLDSVGPAGQATLLDSSVLVVGAGGLGSPVLQYLGAAGVGRLGVADDDTVERSNLQRQVIHDSDDVGRRKVDSAADALAALNPDLTVDRHPVRVDSETAADLVADYDVVVDAADNFPTRFALNDACVRANVPLSVGAVDRFEGQATTIVGGQPCYRCLVPEAPPEGAVADCATAGVLGTLPGTIGTIQATEVLKLLLGAGERVDGPLDDGCLLDGRLLVYDARVFTTETVDFRANPDCPTCGDAGDD